MEGMKWSRQLSVGFGIMRRKGRDKTTLNYRPTSSINTGTKSSTKY